MDRLRSQGGRVKGGGYIKAGMGQTSGLLWTVRSQARSMDIRSMPEAAAGRK